jgi:hypothetical protein
MRLFCTFAMKVFERAPTRTPKPGVRVHQKSVRCSALRERIVKSVRCRLGMGYFLGTRIECVVGIWYEKP